VSAGDGCGVDSSVMAEVRVAPFEVCEGARVTAVRVVSLRQCGGFCQMSGACERADSCVEGSGPSVTLLWEWLCDNGFAEG
jgi:hypothetical protein